MILARRHTDDRAQIRTDGESSVAQDAKRLCSSASRLLQAATILLLSSSFAFADLISLHGSSTFNRELLEGKRAEVEKMAGHTLRIVPNRTALGLEALHDGRADMAMISAPLEEELERLGAKSDIVLNNRFVPHLISTTRVAVGVHPENPVRKATLEQLTKVLIGDISDWSELGGKNWPIRVVFVGEGGGVQSSVESVLLKGKELNPAHVLFVRTAVQLAWVVEQHPNTLAFGQFALLKQRSIPEIETDGYIEQPLSLVTRGRPTPAMEAVIGALRRTAQRR